MLNSAGSAGYLPKVTGYYSVHNRLCPKGNGDAHAITTQTTESPDRTPTAHRAAENWASPEETAGVALNVKPPKKWRYLQ